jgi:hypothetical protein
MQISRPKLEYFVASGSSTNWESLVIVALAVAEKKGVPKIVGPQISVSKEHVYETKVDLSIGQVVSTRWRHLPPIPANNLFSRLLKALITRKRYRAFC